MGTEKAPETKAPVMPFRVAIATTLDPLDVLPKLSGLCGELKSTFDRPASGHLMVSYEELEVGANADGFELMWLPPLIALSLVPAGAAHVLAVPVRNGRTTYATALFTHPDSGIETIADLAGKSAAWVDKHSMAGYVLPRRLLADEGLEPEALGEERFVGAHDKVVAQVLARKADVGATYVRLEDGKVQSAAWGNAEVRVLATFGPIPADVLACGRKVSERKRKRLTELVLDEGSKLGEAARNLMNCDSFATADAQHLDALDALASSS